MESRVKVNSIESDVLEYRPQRSHSTMMSRFHPVLGSADPLHFHATEPFHKHPMRR